jgi:tetratricopeptide (TPR) repeat protein
LFKEETPYWKKRRRLRAILLLVALFLCASLYLVIGGHDINSLSQMIQRLLHPVPVFNSLTIEHNGTEKRLFSGQTLHAHPNDRLKIVKIDTSIPFNREIRLFSHGFDVNALYEEVVFSKLLPNQDIFHRYTFTIEIKHSNENIGEVSLVVEPLTEDWLERANRIIDPEKRLAFLELAVKEKGDSTRLKLRLADEYLTLKKWKEGALIIEDMLRKKEDLDLMKKVIDVYEQLRLYDKLIVTLKKILAKTPDDLGTRLRLAGLLEKKGRLNEAIQEYIVILPQLTNSEKIVCMKNIGYLSFQIGRKDEALKWYLDAAKYDKEDPNLYYNIGSLYEELKKPELAEKYLRIALDLKKTDVEGRLRLAQSLLKRGKLKEAKKYVKEILEQDPNHLEALTLFANIAEKESDKKTLKATYEKILSHDTKNTTILFNLGVLEAEEGNAEKSISHFNRLLKIKPKDLEARAALFDICQRFNRDDLAFQQALILIESIPQKITYYKYIFNYLMTRKDYEKAAHYTRKGVEANPKNFELRQYLILAYLELEKNELAEKEMENALQLKPKNTTLLLQLAKLKEDRGDLESAFELYKKILSISPDNEKAGEAYLRLRLKLLGKGKRVSDYRQWEIRPMKSL